MNNTCATLKGPPSLSVQVLFSFLGRAGVGGGAIPIPRRLPQIWVELLEDESHCGAGSKELTEAVCMSIK